MQARPEYPDSLLYQQLNTYSKGIIMDLSNLSLGDLRNLQDQIKQEMKKREHQEVQKAREQILAIAQSVGLPLKDLINTSGRGAKAEKASGTGSVAVRFRNPADASQQWTGRGRQPKWVKEWVEGGKSIDQLRV
jgi:DNA-binding protein H-NS